MFMLVRLIKDVFRLVKVYLLLWFMISQCNVMSVEVQICTY